jgi:hypothetical protein
MRKRLLLPLLFALATLPACSAESPFSVLGKPKLAQRCTGTSGCPDEARP